MAKTGKQHGVVTPLLEAGVRYDTGDAETGGGVELGGGLRDAGPSGRLTLELNARTLLAHEQEDYREWGAGAAVSVASDPSGRGLSLGLDSSWGAVASGVDAMWSRRDLARRAAEIVVERIETLLGDGAWDGEFRQVPMETLAEDPPEEGCQATEVLEQAARDVLPWTLRLDHPRSFGFVPTAPTWP